MRSLRDHYEARYANIPGTVGQTPAGIESLLPHVLEAMGASARRILDFGCNRGHAARAMARAGHRVVGVDVSKSVLRAAAAESCPRVSFVEIDSQGMLPFADASFDVCFSSEVIEHLFDVRGFLDEVNRVLHDDGLLLLATPYHGRVKSILISAFHFERHFNPTGGHLRFFTPRSLCRCLTETGFTVEQLSGISRCWPVWKLMFVVARKAGGR